MEDKGKKQNQNDQERIDANAIEAKHNEDKEATRQQKVDAAKHFKEIWEAQRELRDQTDAVDKVF